MKTRKRQDAEHLRYQLRYQILPGGDVKDRSEELADFCTTHDVEEVVLFYAAEEWNSGLLSAESEDTWFETVKQAKAVLDAAGIITSLNPWMTALHCDRGRRFPEGRSFRPMVSPRGEVSEACASFACPDWQQYLRAQYRRFAELGFRVIWVEDDLRFHNHAPLTWGGGFEDGVLALFGRKIGRTVTREAVVEAILRPGAPHPWREKWMETWREIHLDVARIMCDAVREGSGGKTAVGLMSSAPHVHSVEGRDWKRLFDALRVDDRVVHRPHFAGYSEMPGKHLDYCFMMLDVQKTLRPTQCEVAPEIENFPFTNWTKSDTQTWCEMALALFHGSDALFLDLFPHSGRVTGDPEIGELLDKSRPALEWIARRFPGDLATRGLGVPWKEDAQLHVRTRKGSSVSELEAADFAGPWKLLVPYGIPVSANTGEVNAIFGALAWAFSDDELRSLLAGGLLLDGESAAILAERGFGEHTGAVMGPRRKREEADYAVETVVSAETGVAQGYCLNANLSDCMYEMASGDGARVWTQIVAADRSAFGAGIVVFTNELGGRVATFATPNPAVLPACYQRQTVVQNLVRFLYAGTPCLSVGGGANLMPMHVAGASEHLIVLNATPDSIPPRITIDGGPSSVPDATLLAPLSAPVPVEIDLARDGEVTRIVPQEPLSYLSFLVLSWTGQAR